MILQALNGYYERLKDDPDSQIPLLGFSWQRISFALLLDKKGKLMQPLDLRQTPKKKPLPIFLKVPEIGKKKAAGIDPCFLWGNTGYVLGRDNKGKPERTIKCCQAFCEFQHTIGNNLLDAGMTAVLNFLDSWNPEDAPNLPYWEEMTTSNLVFMLDGETHYIHEHDVIKQAWMQYYLQEGRETEASCLVSGLKSSVARLHPAIMNVRNAQSTGAAVVSFNKEAFESYNKTQNFNAPIGKAAAFAYTTILNHLLLPTSRQKVFIGDTTTLFWTERTSPVEGFLGFVFDPRDDSGDHQEVRLFLEAAREGKHLPEIDPDINFYILGLSPNASRLCVRYWHVSTVRDVSVKIGQHFNDLAIIKSHPNDPDYPSIKKIVFETAVNHKITYKNIDEKVSPLLAGSIMRSILTGAPYPQNMLSSIIIRIRADQTINYLRAAIIKACLTRKNRINNTQTEVTMTLDKQSTNTAYRLGRMFAALEKAQKDAVPGANTTIRDRYYGSASATPRTVFPQLLRLAQHHIQKSDYGRGTDNLIEEIMEGISEFPAHLSLDDQGMFAIGYYHQRQAFYPKVATE